MMFLFMILLIMLALLMIFITLVVSIGGALSIVIFGDVIICIIIIMWIIRRILNRRN